jgi:hypothetical protein
VQRYQDEDGERIDGILIITPEWYDGSSAHDDPVNKRAGRITPTRELGVPIQHRHPEQEDERRFKTRLMMVWLGLAWMTIVRINAKYRFS